MFVLVVEHLTAGNLQIYGAKYFVLNLKFRCFCLNVLLLIIWKEGEINVYPVEIQPSPTCKEALRFLGQDSPLSLSLTKKKKKSLSFPI